MVEDWSTATFELEAAPEPGGHPRNSFNLDILFVRANFFLKKRRSGHEKIRSLKTGSGRMIGSISFSSQIPFLAQLFCA